MSDVNTIVERYIALRDKKTDLKSEYEKSVAEIDAALEKIELHLLGYMNKNGLESTPTKAGTAYKLKRTYASVADWDLFLGDVITHQRWNMLERRCAKNAVEEFRNVHQDLPPGINWREEITIGVRRS
jgi:hypothetical protein